MSTALWVYAPQSTNLLRDVVADVHLLVVQKHTVDGLDGGLGSLGGLVVNKAVALEPALLIGGDLAGQNVAEGGERIVQGLVVDCLVQVLDENVTLTGLAEGGVPLRPHDAAGAAFDERVVELLQSALTCNPVSFHPTAVTRD